MLLSIVIPVYNERNTLGSVLTAVSRTLPAVPKEVIVIDDCSNDGTREWLQRNIPDGRKSGFGFDLGVDGNLVLESSPKVASVVIRSVYQERNTGKGGALRSGFAVMTGDIVVVQDADLEYDPQDWAPMYDLIAVRKVADVVYGSRFYGLPHRSLYFHHYVGNRAISMLFNVLYNQTLTDIESCYKMMTAQVARSLRLSANDFGIEVEISARIARQRNIRIYELGIRYYGRTYSEGKKVNWKDGIKALWYLFKFRF